MAGTIPIQPLDVSVSWKHLGMALEPILRGAVCVLLGFRGDLVAFWVKRTRGRNLGFFQKRVQSKKPRSWRQSGGNEGNSALPSVVPDKDMR